MKPSLPVDKAVAERRLAQTPPEPAAPSPENPGGWRTVSQPWERVVEDGVLRCRTRVWLVRCEPGEPTPAWPELWDRFRAGDPDVVEVWGESDV